MHVPRHDVQPLVLDYHLPHHVTMSVLTERNLIGYNLSHGEKSGGAEPGPVENRGRTAGERRACCVNGCVCLCGLPSVAVHGGALFCMPTSRGATLCERSERGARKRIVLCPAWRSGPRRGAARLRVRSRGKYMSDTLLTHPDQRGTSRGDRTPADQLVAQHVVAHSSMAQQAHRRAQRAVNSQLPMAHAHGPQHHRAVASRTLRPTAPHSHLADKALAHAATPLGLGTAAVTRPTWPLSCFG